MNRGNRLKLSILIPSHNRNSSLKKLLESLACLKSADVEFIVVINPKAPSPLESEFPWVKFSYSDLGSNPARRQALQLAKGEWCWFIDDDCLLPDSLDLTRLKTLLDAGHVDAYAGTYSAGENLTSSSIAYFIISDCWQKLSFKLGFPALIGGNLLVRRKSIDENFWPSNIKFGGAELIFNLKALEKDLRIQSIPELKLIHNIEPLNNKALAKKAKLQALGSWQIKNENVEKFLSHPMISYALVDHPLFKQADFQGQKEIRKSFAVYQQAFANALNRKFLWVPRLGINNFITQKVLIYKAMKEAEVLQ